MTTTADLAKLQAEAEATQAKAAEAVRAHAEAEAARDQRNADRTANWWTTEGVPAAQAEHGRVAAALAAFREAVASGDGAAVLTAYLNYCVRHAEASVFTQRAKTATMRTEGHGMDERTVFDVNAVTGWPQTFDTLLVKATKDLAQQQGSAYASNKLQPLRDQLEPEDG